jgi:hypothetical protein
MSVIGSNSVASQVYGGVQTRGQGGGAAPAKAALSGGDGNRTSFRLPSSATPRGDWVLSEGVSPQRFEQDSPRGSYLNILI